MRWTLVSAATALVVTVYVSVAVWFPEYYKVWLPLGLLGAVFAAMLMRNPAYRYMRMAWWVAAAWIGATAVPEIKLAFQFGGLGSGNVAVGNPMDAVSHLAFALLLLGCLTLDYFLSPERSAFRVLFGRVHFRLGGQSQNVSGGTAMQFGDVSGRLNVSVHHIDINRELDHAKSLLDKGMPDAAEEHLLRIKRDHEASLTLQQQFRYETYFGKVFHDRGESSKAAVYFRRACKLRPTDEEGRAYGVLGDLMAEEREVAYEKAVDLLREHPGSVLATAVMIRSAPADVTAAKLSALVHVSLNDEVDILGALAVRCLLENEASAAEAYSRRVMAKKPDHPTIVGRVGTAIVIAEGNKIGKQFWDATVSEGSRRRLVEAIGYLTTAVMSATAPGEVRHFQSMRGVAQEILGDLTKAEADYVSSLEEDRTNQESVLRYVTFLGRKDRAEDALRVLRPACVGKSVIIELALLFANLATEIGTADDKHAAVACLKGCFGKLAESTRQQRDDAFRLSSLLAFETAGVDAAMAVVDEFASVRIPDTIRLVVEASIRLKAGDSELANSLASRSMETILPDVALQVRLQVAWLMGDLQRHADVLTVLEPIASAENFAFVGKHALHAAHRCGVDDFVLDYARILREAGRWDATALEMEIETLRRYQEYDLAAEVCQKFILHASNDRDKRLTRLRLSLIGLQSDQPDLIVRDADLLPRVDEVEPSIGQLLCVVLEHGSTPVRALETAYELVRRHYTAYQSHLALCAAAGMGRDSMCPLPETPEVAIGTAVRIRFDANTVPRWVIIEGGAHPDPGRQEYSPTHPLCLELLGKKKGDQFVDRSNKYQERQGIIEEITNRFTFRAVDSFTRWTELFPTIFFALSFDLGQPDNGKPDFGPILRTFEAQEQNEESLRQWYRDHPISLLMMSNASHRHPTIIIPFLAAHPDLPIRCCEGTLDEYERGRRSLGESIFVADPSALATLFVTKLWRSIARLPFKLLVNRNTIDDFQQVLEQFKDGSGERLAKVGQELVVHCSSIVG